MSEVKVICNADEVVIDPKLSISALLAGVVLAAVTGGIVLVLNAAPALVVKGIGFVLFLAAAAAWQFRVAWRFRHAERVGHDGIVVTAQRYLPGGFFPRDQVLAVYRRQERKMTGVEFALADGRNVQMAYSTSADPVATDELVACVATVLDVPVLPATELPYAPSQVRALT